MKEDFLVIDHNEILRILYLKCNTLLKLKEFSNKKNINKILKENNTLNTILDGKCNDIKIEEKIEEKIETTENIIEKTTEEKTEENIMVTIELNNTTKNVEEEKEVSEVVEEIEEIETNDDIEEKHANNKCVDGCSFCANGCDLICTGLGYICSFFSYYMGKLYRKIKKCFN